MRLLRLGVIAIWAAILAGVAGGLEASGAPRAVSAAGVTFTVVRVAMPSVSEVAALPDGSVWFDAGGAPGDMAFGRRGRNGVLSYASPPFALDGARPDRLAVDRSGVIWSTLRAPAGAAIARVEPDGSTATTIRVPVCGTCRLTAIAQATDGTIWTAEDRAALHAFTAAGAPLRTLTPSSSALPPDVIVAALAPGPDGAVWFSGTTRVGRVGPDGTVTAFANPAAPGVTIGDLAAAPDDSAWFTLADAAGARLARLTAAGELTQVSQGLPAGSRPARIAIAPDGAVWFTDAAAPRVGRLVPGGRIETFRLPSPVTSPAAGITVDAEGRAWVAAPAAAALVAIAPVAVSGPVSVARIFPVVAGKLRVELACAASAACRGSLTLRARGRAAARVSFAVPRGRHAVVTLTLDPPTRAALRASRRLRAVLVIAADGRAPVARTILLRT